MAKYTINYSCGHADTIQLFGKISERLQYIQFCETKGKCKECKRNKQAEYVDKTSEEMNLPELSGTDKQIAWAKAIRVKMLDSLDKVIKDKMKYVNDKNQEQAMKSLDKINNAIDKMVETETTSTFWIDNRYNDDNLNILKKYI